jgi:hypothetical protein
LLLVGSGSSALVRNFVLSFKDQEANVVDVRFGTLETSRDVRSSVAISGKTGVARIALQERMFIRCRKCIDREE